jgi:hypothetical protein
LTAHSGSPFLGGAAIQKVLEEDLSMAALAHRLGFQTLAPLRRDNLPYPFFAEPRAENSILVEFSKSMLDLGRK